MQKLPYGISNYEELVNDNYYYVDKTIYIEKLENLAEKRLMALRPRKFGKTLFTSVIENYYDIQKKDKFEKMFGNTYIGKNPTKLRNSYHILRFNFSGIDTETVESTIKGFRREVASSINVFAKRYGINFNVNYEDDAENILDNLFKTFLLEKTNEKIYVIIDEYDHFANELLSFNTNEFKNLVSKNGKVRKWYEILKKATETVVDRIFITGVAPITLDSLTSGFNISKDITRDKEFNEMFGFTQDEILDILKKQNVSKEEQSKILPIMKQNYDGYKFSMNSSEHIYNSNMCLYFLTDYIRLKQIPNQLIDMNIASDYAKLGRMLDLCKGEERKKIIEDTVSGVAIVSDIIEKFNPEKEFTEKELVSMLFYLGYLTISGEEFNVPKLKIPNNVMKEIYADYFMKMLEKQTDFTIEQQDYIQMMREIALEGRLDKICEMLGKYLNHLSNRDFIKFDEKYVKLIFYCIAMNLKIYRIESEQETQRKYMDLLLIPKEQEKGYKAVLIEFKYLKKEEKSQFEELKEDAKKQLLEYAELDEIKQIQNLHKYIVIAVVDEVYIEEV